MDEWFDMAGHHHARTFGHEGRLDALINDWERELAALWRLETGVNNGAYLQFLANWGYESYVYASQALTKIDAHRMAELIDQCQALVDEHIDCATATIEQLQQLAPNRVIGLDGDVIKEEGSILPQPVLDQIHKLSYEFMDYPDDIAALGKKYYATTTGEAEAD